jgi:lambda family phage portal protein
MSAPALFNHRGEVIAPSKPQAGLAGEARNYYSYDAANIANADTAGWLPWVQSPDYEYNLHRDRIVARARDLRRNDGWASGGITSLLDEVIGSHFRMSSHPDYRALKHINSRFDDKWAEDFKKAFEAKFRTWAEDPNFYGDSTQQLSFVQQMRLGLACKLVDGEDLIKLDYDPDQIGYGAAKYATSVLMIDGDRLSNPNEMIDTIDRRGGVQISAKGVPLGYHFRRAHQGDWYGSVQSMEWDYVPRRTAWGRPIIIHDFDRERIDQHRGVPIYAPVMNRLKMLTTFDRAALQAAVINAIFSMSVTSPYDPAGMKDAMDTTQEGEHLWYWKNRKEYRNERPLNLQDARILPLFPGEKAEVLKSERPNAVHDQFAHYALRHMAAQLGTTAEKLTKDWSKVNYSSARAAILDARRTTRRRMGDFCTGTAIPIASAVLEEMMDKGELPLPKRGEVPEFPEARAAYARMRFIGPGQGWIDPTKEAQAALMRMDAGISTGEAETADQGGDFEENLDQRAREIKMMKDRGIPLPKWAAGVDASKTSEKPDAD